MDPFIGLPLYADMTETRVAMHHLKKFTPCQTEENPDPKPTKRLEATHEFDARSGEFQFRQHDTPGFLNNKDDRTLNAVFDEQHYMVLKKGQQLPPYVGGVANLAPQASCPPTALIKFNISTGKGNDECKKSKENW